MVLKANRFESDAVLQGSVLFILYLDDLAKTLLQGTNHSLYTDDLVIWSSFLDPLKSCSHFPEGPRPPWRMVLEMAVNLAKCEYCFFNTNPQQAWLQPQFTLTGTPLSFNFTPIPSYSVWLLTELSPWLTCPLLLSFQRLQSSTLSSKHSSP